MKINLKTLNLARAALVAASALSAPAALADTTSYSNGDLFVGFRKDGVVNTLVAKIGTASAFIPNTIAGGAWDGAPLTIEFGVTPTGHATPGQPVTSLNLDLNATFGGAPGSWATNNPTNGALDVSWAVAGVTNLGAANSPINGLGAGSVFLTVGRDGNDLNTIAAAPGISASARTNINAFANGSGGGTYKNQNSTANSSVAYSGLVADANNWGNSTNKAGLDNSTFVSGFNAEQPSTGLGTGPTNSFLDLYLFPRSGSTLVTDPTYLGTFSLNPSGQLQYSAVPELGSAALLAFGVGLVGLARHRRSAKTETPTPGIHSLINPNLRISTHSQYKESHNL